MTLLNLKNSILFSVLLLILSGCDSTVRREGPTPGLQVRSERMPDARVRINAVSIIDPNLQRRANTVFGMEVLAFSDNAEYIGKIAVENHGSRRSPTGTMEVFVVLRNRISYPLQVECRVLFFDETEVPVEGPTGWQRIFLDENGLGTCRQFSTLLNTSYYYVEVREGR